MKWLFPTISGGLVLALGFIWTRAVSSNKAAALADEARAYAVQMAAAQNFAAGSATGAVSGDAKPAAGNATNSDASEAASTPRSEDRQQQAPPASARPGPTPQREESPKILIVPVEHRDAASLVELIKRMHPRGDNIYADPGTNSLIFPDGVEQKYLEILRLLDQPETKRNIDTASGADKSARSTDPQPRQVSADFNPFLADSRTPAPVGASSPASLEYQQTEIQSQVLANAYRQQQSAAPQDVQKLKQLKSELQDAVHAAFRTRQASQRSQAAQLRTRLEQIERRISERSQLSNEIIERRVEQLLHPEKQWESNDLGGSRSESAAARIPANDAVESVPANQKPADPTNPEKIDGRSSRPPRAAVEANPDRVSQTDSTARHAPGSLPEPAGDVRKDLLTAEAAVASAEAAIAETKAAYERSDLALKGTKTLSEKGVVSEETVRGAEIEFERSRAALNRAESDLGIKRRMLQGARELLALEIKLREADLADAKLRLEHAVADLSRAENLFKSKAGNQLQFEEKKLAEQLAASQYEAAKMLVDLYRQTLPEQISFVDLTRPAGLAGEVTNGAAVVDPPRRADLNLTLDATGDPRKRVLDATHAVTLARAALAEAEVHLMEPDQMLRRYEAANSKAAGTISQQTIFEAEQSLLRTRATVQLKRVDLDIKDRQLAEAREMLAGHIKLLEFDVADTKLRLEHAENELTRAAQLFKSAVISKEDYDTKRLAQRLVESQYNRAQAQLELYRKALPSQDKPIRPAVEETPEAAKPGAGTPDSVEKPNDAAPKAGN